MWAKFDDSYTENRKVRSVSAIAQHLHMVSIIHCAKGETDGFFAKYDLPLVASKARIKSPGSPMKELLDAVLMHDHGDRYEVHDFLDYNPSHAELEAKRQSGATRISNWRRNGRRNKGSNGVTPTVATSVANGVQNESPDPLLSLGTQDHISNPDPERACSNEDATPTPAAIEWFNVFKARWRVSRKGKFYGRGEGDMKALGNLAGMLASVPPEQRIAEWSDRERMIDEFLASTDPKTVSSGFSFSFFVTAFRGLAIPPEQRPKPTANGKPAPMQARY